MGFIKTREDAQRSADQIEFLMGDGKPTTVNGFTFQLVGDTFIMLAGYVPSLGDRFTTEQLVNFIWENREAFGRQLDGSSVDLTAVKAQIA